jgi:hypothetical protein
MTQRPAILPDIEEDEEDEDESNREPLNPTRRRRHGMPLKTPLKCQLNINTTSEKCRAVYNTPSKLARRIHLARLQL